MSASRCIVCTDITSHDLTELCDKCSDRLYKQLDVHPLILDEKAREHVRATAALAIETAQKLVRAREVKA